MTASHKNPNDYGSRRYKIHNPLFVNTAIRLSTEARTANIYDQQANQKHPIAKVTLKELYNSCGVRKIDGYI